MIFHLKGQFSLQEENENQHLYTEAEEWQNVAKDHEKWENEDCFLHHDNSLAYSSSFGQEFLSTHTAWLLSSILILLRFGPM
jgi:hypothetical protein